MCELSFLVFLTGRLRAVARACGEAASVRALLAALPLTRGTRASNFVPAQFFAFFPADFRAKERLLAVCLTDVRRDSLRSQIKRNGLKMDVPSPGLSRFASFQPQLCAPVFQLFPRNALASREKPAGKDVETNNDCERSFFEHGEIKVVLSSRYKVFAIKTKILESRGNFNPVIRFDTWLGNLCSFS